MPIDLFKKTKLPDDVPAELVPVIDVLKSSSGQEECLHRAYEILSGRFHGRHFVTYFKFASLFANDIGKLWKKEGFMHCTNLNYLLRFLLVKSGWFEDREIELRWTSYLFLSPHQYALVDIAGKKTPVDIWAKNFGIRLGDYFHGFHIRSK